MTFTLQLHVNDDYDSRMRKGKKYMHTRKKGKKKERVKRGDLDTHMHTLTHKRNSSESYNAKTNTNMVHYCTFMTSRNNLNICMAAMKNTRTQTNSSMKKKLISPVLSPFCLSDDDTNVQNTRTHSHKHSNLSIEVRKNNLFSGFHFHEYLAHTGTQSWIVNKYLKKNWL